MNFEFSGKHGNCPEALPIEDGVECIDEGKCFKGECVSFCKQLSNDSTPCICENGINIKIKFKVKLNTLRTTIT